MKRKVSALMAVGFLMVLGSYEAFGIKRGISSGLTEDYVWETRQLISVVWGSVVQRGEGSHIQEPIFSACASVLG